MKYYFLSIIGILLCFSVFAQVPQQFQYQAVVRDASGSVLVNQQVGFRLSVISGSPTGTVEYTETHTSFTNDFGVVTLAVGGGTPLGNPFSGISWGTDLHFLKVEADPAGGVLYADMGVTQLLSVPYALYAGNTGQNGVSITWLGTFATAPTSPSLNEAYYNSTDGKSYVFDGAQWQQMTEDGQQGIQGIQGPQGDQGIQGLQGPAGTGLNNRGAWVTGTTYSDGDYVFDRSTGDPLVNSMWICQTVSFVSSTQPYQDAAHWVEFQAPAGPQGVAGTNGTDGKTVLNGTVVPTTQGVNGDFYINTATNMIYGPKTAGVWGSGISLVGPQGATGTNGTNGYSVLNGTTNPTTQGVNGDFYINTTTNTIYGPKSGGIWGSGTSLVGPAGIYTAGTGIQISAGVITNTATDQTVTITAGTGINVTGTYPAFTVTNANPNATHTGDVTGSTALTIANNAVTTAKILDGNVTAAKLNSMSATSGQVLKYNGTNWAPASDNNSGTPGGLNKTIQFNNSGSFGGDTSMIWDNANKRLGVGVTNPTGRMVVQGSATAPANEPLFEIKNSIGQQIMAVYNDSVKFFITDIASNQGGFAVSGRSSSKATTNNFFNISTNAIANNVNSKARILWYPNKEAFLTGRVLIESSDSVGTNSFASGFESKSIGNWSQALGFRARAFGVNSTAIGNYANANADNSFAFGDSAMALGIGSYAIGSVGRDTFGISTNIPTIAFGNYSFSIGLGTRADSTNAFAFGNNTQARGVSSTAFGYESIADGRYAIAGGYKSEAYERSSIALGEDALAYKRGVALGTSAYAGEYSVVLGSYCFTGSNSISIGTGNMCNSNSAIQIGSDNDLNNNASGSVVIGDGNIVSYPNSYAFGNGNHFSNLVPGLNDISMALGNYNTITRLGAMAIGHNLTSSGEYALAIGYFNTASGNFSTSLGRGINTSGQYSIGIALNDQTGTTVAQNNTMAIMGGNVGINTVAPAYRLDVSGDIRSANKIYANANGAAYFQGGDDAEIWDVNVANTLAIYGIQNPALATLRLGNSGADISGSAGNIGIGTITPNVKLDVNGGMALRQTTLPQITAGPVTNYNIGAGSYFRISSNATYAIGGITGGVDGKIIVITNVGAFAINFNNETLTSTAANRFANSTGAQIALAPNGTITYIYDAVTQRWRDIALR